MQRNTAARLSKTHSCIISDCSPSGQINTLRLIIYCGGICDANLPPGLARSGTVEEAMLGVDKKESDITNIG